MTIGAPPTAEHRVVDKGEIIPAGSQRACTRSNEPVCHVIIVYASRGSCVPLHSSTAPGQIIVEKGRTKGGRSRGISRCEGSNDGGERDRAKDICRKREREETRSALNGIAN